MQGGLKLVHQVLIFRIDRLIDDNIITPQTTSLLASQLDISTADTMVLSDGTIYSYGFYI
jgi:hypothetical protein